MDPPLRLEPAEVVNENGVVVLALAYPIKELTDRELKVEHPPDTLIDPEDGLTDAGLKVEYVLPNHG